MHLLQTGGFDAVIGGDPFTDPNPWRLWQIWSGASLPGQVPDGRPWMMQAPQQRRLSFKKRTCGRPQQIVYCEPSGNTGPVRKMSSGGSLRHITWTCPSVKVSGRHVACHRLQNASISGLGSNFGHLIYFWFFEAAHAYVYEHSLLAWPKLEPSLLSDVDL